MHYAYKNAKSVCEHPMYFFPHLMVRAGKDSDKCVYSALYWLLLQIPGCPQIFDAKNEYHCTLMYISIYIFICIVLKRFIEIQTKVL